MGLRTQASTSLKPHSGGNRSHERAGEDYKAIPPCKGQGHKGPLSTAEDGRSSCNSLSLGQLKGTKPECDDDKAPEESGCASGRLQSNCFQTIFLSSRRQTPFPMCDAQSLSDHWAQTTQVEMIPGY